MNLRQHLSTIYGRTAALSLLIFAHGTFAQMQTGVPTTSPFDSLLEATRFIQNYRETAKVSARVFAARAQGSDREYAAFMAKVASADLADFRACMTAVYAAGPLTAIDATELTEIFRSPIGVRLADLSQKMLIADIERGSHKPLDPSLITEQERRELALVYQRPVFARYNAFIASEAQAKSSRKCLAASQVGRDGGIKF